MSDWQSVQNPLAARLLIDPATRRVLAAFRGEGNTVTGAAHSLGLEPDAVLYRVRRGVRAGLLEVTGEQPRRGRPQKIYRLPLPLFVPGDLIPGGPDLLLHADEDAFTAKVRASRAAMLARGRWGLLVYPDETRVVTEISAPQQSAGTHEQLQTRQAPAIIDLHTPLKLTFEEAKTLQAQLWAIYQAQAERTGQDSNYLLRLTLYPAPY
ncbi:ArsR family transcriptional regulator [Deinococcus cavernae]|uniref:ArsR family transcriptional regulator n=1 Tax=Deinococcus cavernae TaxID=2320857 RepID=A0A418V958_9DEIO|nr:helix-turn-helix transcriptional regulator [Deinococcus cavernae]RJF72654.1 ArsR family transcriptional regulator [Deinococcus cavernae]